MNAIRTGGAALAAAGLVAALAACGPSAPDSAEELGAAIERVGFGLSCQETIGPAHVEGAEHVLSCEGDQGASVVAYLFDTEASRDRYLEPSSSPALVGGRWVASGSGEHPTLQELKAELGGGIRHG